LPAATKLLAACTHGGAENDGLKNDGPSKCPGMKLTDIKMEDKFRIGRT